MLDVLQQHCNKTTNKKLRITQKYCFKTLPSRSRKCSFWFYSH